ncbi:MAG: leucine-rich repeat protein [Candidatus Methanoplasma sp.]|jgi:uncharacterized repeat protein (TIGR02543 family)|nr:leucine-rich repeat protein [Candidatus Methanoplasma sp.]
MDETRSKGVRKGTGEGNDTGKKNKIMIISVALAAAIVCVAAVALIASGGGSAGNENGAPGGAGGGSDGGAGRGGGLPPVATYSVDFDVGGGTPVASQDVFEGGRAHKPSDPAKAGMDFAGWYRDPSLSVPWDFDDKVTGNMTLYAKWGGESGEAGPTFKVSFDTTGGSALPDATGIAPGSRIVAPPKPARDGYRLDGWYRDGALSERWDFSADRVTGDMVLYAGWVEVYALRYHFPVAGVAESDWRIETAHFAVGDVVDLMRPERDPYAFGGWFMMPGGVNYVPGDSAQYNIDRCPDTALWNQTAELDLYAHWLGTPGLDYPESPSSAGERAVARGSAFAAHVVIQDYYLGEPVTSVSPSAFKNMPFLKSITLPGAVRDIGSSAFAGSGLSGKLTIPAGVETIRDGAFKECYWISEIAFASGSGLREIGDRAFFEGNGLNAALNLPHGLEKIGNGAFQSCEGISGLIIPASVTLIGDYAFFGCLEISGALTIPSGAANIGDYAFAGCIGVSDLTISLGVESIGQGAFNGCEGISGLAIPASVTSIGPNAFEGCTGIQGRLDIPSGMESIGSRAFAGCTGLSSVYMPTGSLAQGFTIGSGLFDMCSPSLAVYVDDPAHVSSWLAGWSGVAGDPVSQLPRP